MPTSSSRREVDAYANIPSVVANSSTGISGCAKSVKPDGVSLGSRLSDQELATDNELSQIMNFQVMRMSVLTVTLALITTWTIYALLNLLNSN